MLSDTQPKVVLITGAAKRIGAEVARLLHTANMNIIIHYRHSLEEARALCNELNTKRASSAHFLQGDLTKIETFPRLIEQANAFWQRLDVLVNNASSFYSTPFGTINESQWDDLLASNVKAPLFLAQTAAKVLRKSQGSIINIADIHADKPLRNYTVYCIAKAGLVMLTKSLAKELGPEVRVNAISPGAILWPSDGNELNENQKQKIISSTALKRPGRPQSIAKAIRFLIEDADYVTGQVIAVDGGRTLD